MLSVSCCLGSRCMYMYQAGIIRSSGIVTFTEWATSMEPEGDYSSYSRLMGWRSHKTNRGAATAFTPESPRSAQSQQDYGSASKPKHTGREEIWNNYDESSSDDDTGILGQHQEAIQDDDIVILDEQESALLEESFLPPPRNNGDEELPEEHQNQEQRDYELAKRLMDEPSTTPGPAPLLPPQLHTTSITGKALALVHALQDSIDSIEDLDESQDPKSRMVSMVNGPLIHASTERLLAFQQNIMHKNDHIIQRANQYIQYNSDIEESDNEPDYDRDQNVTEDHLSLDHHHRDEHDETDSRSEGPVNQPLLDAAVTAQIVELIDICYGAFDATGAIVKHPSPATFGRGIYTSNTPFSPIFYTGENKKQPKLNLILMARIKGKVEYIQATGASQSDNKIKGQADSAVILTPGTADEICILRRSSQFIPLLVIRPPEPGSGRHVLNFDDDSAIGNDIIHRHVCQLQRLVDQILHQKDRHTSSIPQRILPSEVRGNTDPSAVSSIRLANSEQLPRSMMAWSLRTVVYYSSPETIDDRAFCFPSKEKFENYLKTKLPHDTKHQDNNMKCTICGTRGDVKTLPESPRHPFHMQCLVRRLLMGTLNLNCPSCDIPLRYRQTAAINSVNKDPAVILNFRIGDDLSLSDQPKEPSAHDHCQAPTSVLTVLVPIFDDTMSPMSSINALTIRYDCASTFQLKLAAPPRRSNSVAKQWDLNFSDPQFLMQLQKRVKAHNAKCTACQRRIEGRRRSILLRYTVPQNSVIPATTDTKILIGTMPSGSMRVDDIPGLACSGHPRGIFAIKYCIDAGVQKDYHDHPGVAFAAFYRTAYLPNSAAGRELLERLIIAFTHGLTFLIGTSEKTGVSQSVIKWSTIPHKTSLSPGLFGYPDFSYFAAAHAELDALGVPRVAQ